MTKPTSTGVYGAPGADLVVSPRSQWRIARPPLFRGGGPNLSAVRNARRLVLSACGRWRSRFLSGGGCRHAALTAPLPAAPRWLSWRRRNRVAALALAWRSVPALRGDDAPSRRGARCPSARALCVWPLTRPLPLWRRSSSRGDQGAAACGAYRASLVSRRVARAPATECKRHNGARPARRGAQCSAARALCVRSLALSRPLSGRSPSHGTRSGAACGAAPALLVPAQSRRRAYGRVALGRRFSCRRLAFSARCVVLSSSRSLLVVVGAVSSSVGPDVVAQRSRRRCLRRLAGAPGAGLVVPPRSRRRGAQPPLFRGGGSLPQRGA